MVYTPKREGGLGVRDLRQVNLALLAKWHWRLLTDALGIWKSILVGRYGECFPSPRGRPNSLRRFSTWWYNISLLGGPSDATSDWFSQGVVQIIGDGLSTFFWHDPWCGSTTLNVRFSGLFNLSLNKDVLVGELGSWVRDVWV